MQHLCQDISHKNQYNTQFSTLREKPLHCINHKYISIIMHNNTCFGACLYSMRTQHGNLHQSHVTTSRVTYFILRAHGRIRERLWEEMKVNGPER